MPASPGTDLSQFGRPALPLQHGLRQRGSPIRTAEEASAEPRTARNGFVVVVHQHLPFGREAAESHLRTVNVAAVRSDGRLDGSRPSPTSLGSLSSTCGPLPTLPGDMHDACVHASQRLAGDVTLCSPARLLRARSDARADQPDAYGPYLRDARSRALPRRVCVLRDG